LFFPSCFGFRRCGDLKDETVNMANLPGNPAGNPICERGPGGGKSRPQAA
jgi:hypothetical protein